GGPYSRARHPAAPSAPRARRRHWRFPEAGPSKEDRSRVCRSLAALLRNSRKQPLNADRAANRWHLRLRAKRREQPVIAATATDHRISAERVYAELENKARVIGHVAAK